MPKNCFYKVFPNAHQEKPCKNSFLAYLFFINICKITINFLVKRLEMSGEELKKGFLRDDMVGFI